MCVFDAKEGKCGCRRTSSSWTAPQKQVAVALWGAIVEAFDLVVFVFDVKDVFTMLQKARKGEVDGSYAVLLIYKLLKLLKLLKMR